MVYMNSVVASLVAVLFDLKLMSFPGLISICSFILDLQFKIVMFQSLNKNVEESDQKTKPENNISKFY